MKTILITGGTGFLGSRITKILAEEGFDVIQLKHQKEDEPAMAVEDYFLGKKIDAIIHTATCYGRRNEPWSTIADTNLLLPLRLMIAGEKSGVKCFINADTFFNEKIVFEGHVDQYVRTKKSFLGFARNNAPFMKMKFANMKIEQMYGPNDGMEKFVPTAIRQLLSGATSLPFTAGEQRRDFVFVDDVARAFVEAMKHADSMTQFEEFGIGSGRSTSIKEAVTYLKEVSGSKAETTFGALPYRENEIMDSFASLDNNKLIGWSATTPWHEGFKTTVESYKKTAQQST